MVETVASKVDGCDEINLVIKFDTSNQAEEAFFKALTNSLIARHC
jgi:hypothetical protein